MFTGIIRYTGRIQSVHTHGQGRRLSIEAPGEILSRLEAGITSLALDGSCHTIEEVREGSFTVYSSYETLQRSTLGQAEPGRVLNLELPLTPQTLLDGHLVQGHVDGMGKLISRQEQSEAWSYTFEVPAGLEIYLAEKDSIAVDGISLTLFHIQGRRFEVAVIPLTARKTSLASRRPGDAVNLEINIFAKYARRFLLGESQPSRLEDWIREQSGGRSG